MATFQFELVSPDQLLYSAEVESVVVPGTEGEFTVLPNHAAVVTSLRNGGVILVNGAESSKEFAVFGGIAEVTNSSLTILAERTTPLKDVTTEVLDKDILTAQTYLEAARNEDEKRVLSEKIAQLEEFRHVVASRHAS
ncbi:ATP synthase F1 subcomplex epsilon subunit [Rhizobiales bacterium GAS191]|jgi:F-type H+-transporting ATPase subunit epsilon|nr:ATP synthase F1 subcomplex epsilon subunit [Rhizobiales bacterium GAS113]SED32199.1 ATP synthase F1 subcomplex epsilon subunit [Rhizobiales bacterium GAS188]SEE96548.1 ATP synthase F1 subcomplex epsilon subunit [Rhizobiales bacterium GAS191]